MLESQASETAVCVTEVVRRFGGAVGAVEPVVGGGGGGGVVAVGGGGGGVAGSQALVVTRRVDFAPTVPVVSTPATA